MTSWLNSIRECYWSDLCATDREAYANFLDKAHKSVQDGIRTVAVGDRYGSRNVTQCSSGGIDNDVRLVIQGGHCDLTEEVAMGSCGTDSGSVVDTQDNGHCGLGSQRMGVGDSRFSGCGVDDCIGGVFCVGNATTLRYDDGRIKDTEFDAGSVGASQEVLSDQSASAEITVPVVGKQHYRNRAKRAKKKNRSVSASDSEKKKMVDRCEVNSVPEWRRKGTGAHVGAFVECSEDVQKNLRDSYARMLIGQNETKLVKAEAERRRVAALLKSQVIEREVESRRLKLDSDLVKARVQHDSTIRPGFAETIVSEGLQSVCSVPALSDGSISPDSSISVAELHKLNESLSRAAEDRVELRMKLEKRDEEVQELTDQLKKQKLENSVVREAPRRVQGYAGFHPKIHDGNGHSSWSYY